MNKGGGPTYKVDVPTPRVEVRVLHVGEDDVTVELSGALSGKPNFYLTRSANHIIVQIPPEFELVGRKENRQPIINAVKAAFPECKVGTRSRVKSAGSGFRNYGSGSARPNGDEFDDDDGEDNRGNRSSSPRSRK